MFSRSTPIALAIAVTLVAPTAFALAVEDEEMWKRPCYRDGRITWVEHTQSCPPVDPCEDARKACDPEDGVDTGVSLLP